MLNPEFVPAKILDFDSPPSPPHEPRRLKSWAHALFGLTTVLTAVGLEGLSVKVCLLQVTIYQDDGWTWRTERFRNPHWDDIDMAIRRLDRFHYPFVWLFRNADVEEDALPEFNVMGGKGEYTMDYGPEGTELRYYEPTRGDEEIEVWQSNQGYACQAKYCCPSLDIVLRVTRYFAEHGTLDPSVTWQPC